MKLAWMVGTLALATPGYLMSAPPSAMEAGGLVNADRLSTRLDSIAMKNAVVGYAVGIVEDGRLAYVHAFGERELGSGSGLDTASVFHWASVSKPFVATAVMQLNERGLLDLDARLVDVLPEYKSSDPRSRDITIRQLLLHTSGLPDVEDYQWDRPVYDDRALARWVLEDSPRELLFDPGTDRQYSNLGYEVLGLVIEETSGMVFEQYMARNVFEPLGMARSTFLYPEVPEGLRTVGYTGSENRVPVGHYPYNRRHAPSSTLNTNVEDMARFAIALLDGGELDGVRILGQDTVKDMWAPRWTVRDDPFKAGAMGWVVEDYEGRRMVRHFGWDDGFRSALIIFPADMSAVFLVTNDETAPIGEFIKAAISELPTAGDRGPRP